MRSNANKRARKVIDVEIIDMSHDGRGVARVDGKTVFIDGALTGEQVSAQIVKRKRSFDQARVLTVENPSADRVTPKCAVFGTCGGCAVQHMSAASQRDMKRAALRNAFEKLGDVAPSRWLDDLAAEPWAYRRKARLGVKYVSKKDRVLVGFRERLAPYVTDMTRCEVLVEPVASLITPLADLIQGLSIRTQLPQIEVACGDEVTALVMRVLEPPGAADEEALRQFGAHHEVDIYLQTGGHDSVAPLGASRPLRYALPDFDVVLEFLPLDFIQVNAQLNRAMVSHVVDLLQLDGDQRVLDLFCGLGNFTLPLARRAAHVVGVEGDAALVKRARTNATANGIVNSEFFSADLFADAATWQWPQQGFDRVLLDPPRTGAQEVLAAVANSGASRVVYVSCHPGTLARDAQQLVHQHGFELESAGIMDMFAHTAHVESVATFVRR